MPTYERVLDGTVVERVTPIEGDYEDTRLGLLTLEDGSEWRITAADDTAPSTPDSTDPPPLVDEQTPTQQKRK
jgi:hypothetical protein